MTHQRIRLTTALLLVAAGCSHSSSPAASPAPESSGEAEQSSRAVPVQVNNENYNSMNVYLLQGGTRWLVGRVDGLSDVTLTIPASVAPPDHQVRLRAEAVGGGGTTTPLLIVAPGQQVYWTIGSDLSTSTASAG